MSQQQTTDYGILTQSEFLDEFEYRYKPGQHVVFFGPTGRGKTTLASKMLARVVKLFEGGLTIQLGHDPALVNFGKPIGDWPPKLPLALLTYDEKPLIRRYQPKPTKPEHFAAIHNQAGKMLRWMFAREDWIIFIPDLQVVTDPGMMGLGKEVDQLLLTLRKAKSSVWMDAQAPRWVPRSAGDMTSHLLIWRNRDEAVVKRLSEIMGLPIKFVLELFGKMDYHDAIWIDSVMDEYFIVKGS